VLVIQAASADDLTAIAVNRYIGSSSIWINLIDLLGEAGLMVKTGYRERYAAAFVPEGSPLWPGLVIDLSHSKQRRVESGYKKKATPAEATETVAAAKEVKSSQKKESEPAAVKTAETTKA